MTSPIKVQVKDIETELDKIYENNGQEIIHACLFNLIVYSPNMKRTEELNKITACVTDKFPCRIFFIQVDENSKDTLTVKISNQKVSRDDGKVVYDLIHFDVSNDQLKRIPFILTPNFVPELPIYLLWGQDLTIENEILDDLINIVDRVIFNSAWVDNLQVFSLKLLPMLECIKIDTMDITWAALGGWRDVLALTFDCPEKIADLYNTKDLEICYNKQNKHDAFAAIFLQGWIASRLKWNYLDKEAFRDQTVLAYNNKIRDAAVRLTAKPRADVAPGAIHAINFTALNENTYALDRKKDSNKVMLHVSTPSICELPITMHLQELLKGFNFMREVFYQNMGEHYISMLRKISETNWEN